MKALALALIVGVFPFSARAGEPLFHVDFDTDAAGPYTRAEVAADFHHPSWSDGIDEGLAEIVATSCGKALQVRYPAGQVGGGVKIPVRLPRRDALYLAYRVWFPPDFVFVKEGKLSGLCGGTCNSGGHPANGHDGWSSRVIWQAGGQAAQYVYAADQKGRYGDTSLWNPGALTPGTWHFVETYVRINTPGQADGVITSWLDGRQAYDRHDVRFRDTDAFAIDSFVFETFFGGGTPDYAPPSDQYARFADITVSDSPISASDCVKS